MIEPRNNNNNNTLSLAFSTYATTLSLAFPTYARTLSLAIFNLREDFKPRTFDVREDIEPRIFNLREDTEPCISGIDHFQYRRSHPGFGCSGRTRGHGMSITKEPIQYGNCSFRIEPLVSRGR